MNHNLFLLCFRPGGVREWNSEAQRCSEGDGWGGLRLQRAHPAAAFHHADSLRHSQRSVPGHCGSFSRAKMDSRLCKTCRRRFVFSQGGNDIILLNGEYSEKEIIPRAVFHIRRALFNLVDEEKIWMLKRVIVAAGYEWKEGEQRRKLYALLLITPD